MFKAERFGSVSINPTSPVYDHGTVVTLPVTANPDSEFVGWSGDVISTVTLTMNADNVITNGQP
ncbi:MAG: hypothetical protein GY832_09425 [Chloroflexi bacterium]|nr:hypothetical protein [Chloroflexota bacterium]